MWWISVAYLIWAAFRAYEVLILAVIGAIVYVGFLGLAALPIAGAIIVGSCIIAAAIYAKKK